MFHHILYFNQCTKELTICVKQLYRYHQDITVDTDPQFQGLKSIYLIENTFQSTTSWSLEPIDITRCFLSDNAVPDYSCIQFVLVFGGILASVLTSASKMHIELRSGDLSLLYMKEHCGSCGSGGRVVVQKLWHWWFDSLLLLPYFKVSLGKTLNLQLPLVGQASCMAVLPLVCECVCVNKKQCKLLWVKKVTIQIRMDLQ